MRFRGPKRSLAEPYVACIGGTETFGRFVGAPFPALLEQRLGRPCINLGSLASGLDAILNDAELMRIARLAKTRILQLPPAQNLSNRMYRVHPRRNDRFVAASATLTALYPDVDFTEFHFTKHLLLKLQEQSSDRFALVTAELRQAWTARMTQLLAAMGGPVLLLWLRYGASQGDCATASLGPDPLFVTDEMVETLRGRFTAIVEVPVCGAGDSDELEDMVFGTLQEPAAEHMIGPATHRAISDRLVRAIRDLE